MALLKIYSKLIENYFETLFSGVVSIEIKRVWLLVLTAQDGPFSRFWYDYFLELGVLHILVFSGSQIGHISRVVKLGFSLFPASSIGEILSLRYLFCGAEAVFLLLVGFFLEWPPPATRAILFEFCGLSFPRGTIAFRASLSFFLQMILFYEHVGSLSWFLSWGVWLVSGYLSSVVSVSWSNCITSVGVWLLLGVFLKGQSLWSLTLAIPMVVGANFLLGLLFDKVIFRVGAFLWVSVILGSTVQIILGADWGWNTVSKLFWPIIESSTGLLLVALHAFGYIKDVL